MIIYWSMLLWPAFIYLIYSAANKRKEEKAFALSGNVKAVKPPESDKFPLSYAIIIFAFFTFWIGMRGPMFDTWLYIEEFNNIPADFSLAWSEIDWDSKAPGFGAFNIIFKCFISKDYHWWLMTLAIISMLPLMQVLRKYSCDFFFSSFVFVALTTFTWPMNGMRQFICVAILFGCCDLIKDGKFIKFAIVVLLLSTVHYTCLMMLLVYFVAKSKPWQMRIFIFIIIIALACMFAEPLFAGLEDTVLSGTAYAGATAQFANDDGVNPLRALFYAVFPVLAFIRRKSLEEHYDSNPMLPIAINMSLVSAMLYVVGIFTSGILIGRLPIYCSVYNMILIPCIINYGFNEKDRRIVRMFAVLYLMVMFYMECPGYYNSDLTGIIM